MFRVSDAVRFIQLYSIVLNEKGLNLYIFYLNRIDFLFEGN